MRLLANPYVFIAIVLALLLAAASGYRAGHTHAAGACAAEKAGALARAIHQAEEIARQDAEVLAAHEQKKERIRTVFQPIRERVTRYVQDHAGAADECLDPDGLRLWRAANAGDASAVSQPDYSLSGTAAATLDTGGRLAGQPRASGGAVSRVPGTSPGAGGVGE